MSEFVVRPAEMNNTMSVLEKMVTVLDAAASAVNDVKWGLQIEIRTRDRLDSRMSLAANRLKTEREALKRVVYAGREISQMYTSCEQRVTQKCARPGTLQTDLGALMAAYGLGSAGVNLALMTGQALVADVTNLMTAWFQGDQLNYQGEVATNSGLAGILWRGTIYSNHVNSYSTTDNLVINTGAGAQAVQVTTKVTQRVSGVAIKEGESTGSGVDYGAGKNTVSNGQGCGQIWAETVVETSYRLASGIVITSAITYATSVSVGWYMTANSDGSARAVTVTSTSQGYTNTRQGEKISQKARAGYESAIDWLRELGPNLQPGWSGWHL